MDSTPGPINAEPDRPDGAPAWFLIAILVLFALVLTWVALTFGGGRAL